MKKLVVIFSIVMMGISLKAQQPMAVNIPKTCQNWLEEIHKILLAKMDDKNAVMLITSVADCSRIGLKYGVSVTKKTLIVDDVSFYPKSKKFKKTINVLSQIMVFSKN